MKKRTRRLISTVLLILLLMPNFFPAAYADGGSSAAKRWNIMLVVDGSGSLFSGPTTDPDELRFEAIDDLLGILQDNGNNVGALVFSANPYRNDSDEKMLEGIRMNTGLISFDGPAPDGGDPKDYIIYQLRHTPKDYSSGGATDIGTALLVAENMLEEAQKENGLDSIVFLFTDGVTELNYKGTYKKSLENMRQAEERMNESGIKLCGVFLNKNNRSKSTEVLDMVRAANGIDNNTLTLGDTYIEIADSASCHAAMQNFMRLLGFSTSPASSVPGTITFRVPGTGAEEANIRIYSTTGESLPKDLSVTITSPDGTIYFGAEVEGICRSGRTFKNYKLVNPDSGTWTVAVDTNSSSVGAVCELVFTMDKEAIMETSADADKIHTNMDLTVAGYLTHNGEKVNDAAEYREYSCALVLRDVATGEELTYEIVPNEQGKYERTIRLDQYGIFEARVEFTCDSICIQTEPQIWNMENKAPSVANADLKISYGLILNNTYKYDLAGLLSDQEDGNRLIIYVDSENCNMDAVSLNGTELLIKSKEVGDGSIDIKAVDSQGAAGTGRINVHTKNMTLIYILAVVALLVLIFAAIVIAMRKRPRLDGELTLRVPFNGTQVEIPLPTPGSQCSRSPSLKELIDMETGAGRAIRSACNDDYNQIVDMLAAENFNRIKISIVRGKTKAKDGKAHSVGKLKVSQGKKTSVIYNGSVKLAASNDGYDLAYYVEQDDDDDSWDAFDQDDSFDPVDQDDFYLPDD